MYILFGWIYRNWNSPLQILADCVQDLQKLSQPLPGGFRATLPGPKRQERCSLSTYRYTIIISCQRIRIYEKYQEVTEEIEFESLNSFQKLKNQKIENRKSISFF